MARIEIPREISEAPADRIFISVPVDGQPRMLSGARSPTIGQGAGDAASRQPSAYMLGNRNQGQNQQTTIQIVMRALVGTVLFDYLDEKSRDSGSIDLDFRTFGDIQHRFTVGDDSDNFKVLFEIEAEVSTGGAKGLSLIKGKANSTTGHQTAKFFEFDNSHVDETGNAGRELDPKRIREGGVLEVIDGSLSKDDYTIKLTGVSNEYEFVNVASNPLFLVCSAILYNDDKLAPQVYVPGRTAIANWPNDGQGSAAVIDHAGTLGKLQVVHRNQSVKWTAKGTVGGFQPTPGEDSLLYTLDVTLTEAMTKPILIHSSEAHYGNPAY